MAEKVAAQAAAVVVEAIELSVLKPRSGSGNIRIERSMLGL
jgi:hypothetical protein